MYPAISIPVPKGTFNGESTTQVVPKTTPQIVAGEGEITYDNGGHYHGEVKNDLRWGTGTFKGTYYYYEGEWQRDKEHGQGLLRRSDGEVYEGWFKDGKLEGTGTMTQTGGWRYEGDWIDSRQDGRGVQTWPRGGGLWEDESNGDVKYVGDWKGGWRHGHGISTGESGNTYDGEWKKGKKHGKGYVTNSKTGKKTLRHYKHGERVDDDD